jgi:DNA helicase II / ATP-dependent DNA helicase PcrA
MLNDKVSDWLAELNPRQREAVTFGAGPLLIVAGAGTGKTRTLACRVSYLLSQGVAPERILLLTFTRRAAEEMLKRATSVNSADAGLARRVWGGTFHAMANRLLRIYAQSIGLSPDFNILDRADAEDFLNLVRTDLAFSAKDARFPRKGACLSIYSQRVNGDEELETVLKKDFPWCLIWKDELNLLFREYTQRKQKQNLTDYDDLLLYWYHLVREDSLARAVGGRFDHILVDEYQDTNPTQARILLAMRRANPNITVVGDDAQSIYSFRSATVRNMLDFPAQFPGTTVLTLEQNYRSLPPILQTTNYLIAESKERYAKNLWTERKGGQKPQLITCRDETEQDEAVISRVLEHYEEGIPLKKQAVLFRAASHSDSLELALRRHNIPFHKYGGLRFLENAHIKDLIGLLRIAANPRDQVAWLRILQLISGIGPATAQSTFRHLSDHQSQIGSLKSFRPPASAREEMESLLALLIELQELGEGDPSQQIERVSRFYLPLLQRNYENPEPRASDLEHLAQLARRYSTRSQFLAEIVLDPPVSTGDLAGPPVVDEDWLTLSTIHSAKGLEWKAVYLIHASDGNLPADMATGSDQEIEEELRLCYVALTRACDFLYVFWPLRYYSRPGGLSDRHNYAQPSRFFTPAVRDSMDCVSTRGEGVADDAPDPGQLRQDIFDRINDLWK